MKNNKKALLKHFSAVFRKRALAEKANEEEISLNLLKYFNRKELIQIITNKFDGTIPKEHNLVELENEDLLKIIGDEMYIISFVTKQWSLEIKAKSLQNQTLLDEKDKIDIIKPKVNLKKK